MIVLLINAHPDNQTGKARFNVYHQNILKVLKKTVYYGNEIELLIRTKDQLDDYIYDQITYRCDEKARQKFDSLDYIFIDGPSIAPWSKNMSQLLLFVKNCIRQNKKIHCNGYAHFAAYFYLSTQFQKQFYICSKSKITEQNIKKVDYQYQEVSGDLSFRGKKICNSGVKIVSFTNRPYTAKSTQAVNNGVVLSTKYDYVVFNSKNGQKILNNINFPFTFYWKEKVLCTSKTISQTKANILVQSEIGSPFAFTYKNCLSTQGLCSQFLEIIQNWLNISLGKPQNSESNLKFSNFQTISFDNKLSLLKTGYTGDLNSISRIKSIRNQTIQLKHSKFMVQNFQKPAIRCGDRYQSQQQKRQKNLKMNNVLNFGKSRMIFKGSLEETQIKNYVQRTPSRPVTAHKFRQISKQKWMSPRHFFLS